MISTAALRTRINQQIIPIAIFFLRRQNILREFWLQISNSFGWLVFEAFTHRSCLHAEAFAHRSFYTQELLHRRFYTQTLLHTEALTHSKLLHTEAFSHRRFYTQKLLHTEAFTHRNFYTQKLLHTNTFTHRDRTREIAILPQFLAIEPHFVRKGCAGRFASRTFTSVFRDRNSFRAKGLRPDP